MSDKSPRTAARIRSTLITPIKKLRRPRTRQVSKFRRTVQAVGEWFRRIGAWVVRISPPWLRRIGVVIAVPFRAVRRRQRAYLARRPHRSFRLTRRRDYKRSLELPGYWSFSRYVWTTLWREKRLFGGLLLTYMLISLAISGIGAQESYRNLSDALTETGGDVFTGNWGKVGAAGLLLVTTVTSGLTPSATEAQSVIGGLAVFFAWLTAVWLLRNVLAGRKVRLRDGLYNSGAPILSTLIVGLILVVQLIPVSLALLVYSAASTTGLLDSGVAAMLFWVAAAAFVTMTLYWITSTLIALVVVTLPGMYPFQALRAAGDLIIGRRLRVLYRWAWMVLLIVVAWLLVVIPIILLDGWLVQAAPSVAWLPLVPMAVLFMGSATLIFAAAYVYLLYRKVVDDDASPA